MKARTCSICALPIASGERTEKTGELRAHRICFDISVANLSEEVGAVLRSQPEKYREIRPGIFREIEEAK